MAQEFTGYPIELERRDEIESTSTPILFTSSDFKAPEEIDPRKLVRHDKQFNMGACGGFGNTGVGELLWAYASGAKEWKADRQFSQLFAYLEAQRFDGLIGVDRGSTIAGGLKVAREVGYLPHDGLPYRTPYPRNARSLVTAAMRTNAAVFRVRSHTWLKGYQAGFDYLASGVGGIFVGTAWNDSFYAPNGVLERVRFTRADGGHAYSFLGYSRRKDSRGRNYWWRLNSHNDSFVEVAPSVIDQLFAHDWTAMVGMSDLTTPEPRNVDFSKESVIG